MKTIKEMILENILTEATSWKEREKLFNKVLGDLRKTIMSKGVGEVGFVFDEKSMRSGKDKTRAEFTTWVSSEKLNGKLEDPVFDFIEGIKEEGNDQKVIAKIKQLGEDQTVISEIQKRLASLKQFGSVFSVSLDDDIKDHRKHAYTVNVYVYLDPTGKIVK